MFALQLAQTVLIVGVTSLKAKAPRMDRSHLHMLRKRWLCHLYKPTSTTIGPINAGAYQTESCRLETPRLAPWRPMPDSQPLSRNRPQSKVSVLQVHSELAPSKTKPPIPHSQSQQTKENEKSMTGLQRKSFVDSSSQHSVQELPQLDKADSNHNNDSLLREDAQRHHSTRQKSKPGEPVCTFALQLARTVLIDGVTSLSRRRLQGWRHPQKNKALDNGAFSTSPPVKDTPPEEDTPESATDGKPERKCMRHRRA